MRPNDIIHIRHKGTESQSGFKYHYLRATSTTGGNEARIEASANNEFDTSAHIDLNGGGAPTVVSGGFGWNTTSCDVSYHVKILSSENHDWDLWGYYTDMLNNTYGYFDLGYNIRVDNAAPALSTSISSSSWAPSVSVNATAADSRSGLASYDYAWSTSTSRPSSGWVASGVSGHPSSKAVTAIKSGNGTWYLHLRATDGVGHSTSAYYKGPFRVDVTPPSGSIVINGGDTYTSNTSVTLTLSASDSHSGVSQMCFSNDGSNWSTAEAYTTTKSWTLSSGDGTKTVYARFIDWAGLSTTVSDTIVLDTQNPASPGTPGFSNSNGQVTFTWTASSDSGSGVNSYEIKLGRTSGAEDVLPLHNIGNVTSYVYNLTPGTCYISVRAKDNSGKFSSFATSQLTVAEQILAQYQYNMVGQVTRKSWMSNPASGYYDQYVDYSYDQAGRLIKKTYSVSSSQVLYKYDTASNLTKAHYTHSGSESYYVNTDYTYNARNFLTGYTQNVNGSTKTVNYTPTLSGVVEQLAYPSTSRQVTYIYDLMGRLVKVRDASIYYAGSATTNGLVYRNTGFLEKINYANGMVEEFTPDVRNRIDHIKLYPSSSPSSLMLNLDYTLDGQGNVLSIGSDQFKYDGMSRLTASKVNGAISIYRMDRAGNRVRSDEGGTVTYYTYDGLNIQCTGSRP